MASLCALRTELHSVILRGVRRIREIEIAYRVAEEQLLEARMVVAASLDDQWDDEWAPSPEEIEAACTAIQSEWSDDDRDQRWRPDRQNLVVRRYYDRHRAEILQRNKDRREKDPEAAARQREAARRWKERNQAAVKEHRHARREIINDQRRARRTQLSDEQREAARAYNRQYRELHKAEQAEQRRANREHHNRVQREWRARERHGATELATAAS